MRILGLPCLAALLLLVGCQSKSPSPSPSPSESPAKTASHERIPFIGGDPTTRALATRFLGAQTPAVIHALRPTRAELDAIFDAPSAATLDDFYGKLWAGPNLASIPAIPADTTVTIDVATTDELKRERPPFPPDMRRAARRMKPGLSFVSLRFQSGPLDMSFDAFTQVSGRWVLLPTPWNGLPPGD